MTLRNALLIALSLLLVACAAQTKLTTVWADPDHHGPRFRHVLVVGFGEDGASRRVFEEEFVRALKAVGIAAQPSFSLESGVRETDLERVRELVRRSGADGVLTTRLVGVDKRVSYMPGQVVVAPGLGYRRGFYGYYSSAIVMSTPPSTFNYEVVTLETNLWQVVGEDLVWSGTTETFAPENARALAVDFAKVITEALRGRGLI